MFEDQLGHSNYLHGWVTKEKTKCLSKILGHHVPPEHTLQVSELCTEDREQPNTVCTSSLATHTALFTVAGQHENQHAGEVHFGLGLTLNTEGRKCFCF